MGIPSLSSTTNVHIRVINKEDEPPEFEQESYNFEVFENNCTDNDQRFNRGIDTRLYNDEENETDNKRIAYGSNVVRNIYYDIIHFANEQHKANALNSKNNRKGHGREINNNKKKKKKIGSSNCMSRNGLFVNINNFNDENNNNQINNRNGYVIGKVSAIDNDHSSTSPIHYSLPHPPLDHHGLTFSLLFKTFLLLFQFF